LGVIGRNGAGKSTLLKILSRVTSPTIGQVKVKGRIASLLEVGTGFHPELTGRENIFLNGAILGMTKSEIRARFDEIVDFSGVETFVDTPVKRYSSGMYVRLAFAVAANLGADIMMIDEVLAVGDLEFQKKCLGKMESISKQSGRTILFVSHNMAAISALCNRVVYLKQGKMVFDGPCRDGLDRYLSDNLSLVDTSLAARPDRMGEGRIRFQSTWTENELGQPKDVFLSGEPLVIAARILIEDSMVGKKISAAFQLHDPADYVISDLKTRSLAVEFPVIKSGDAVIRCVVPRLPLMSGVYNHDVIVWANDVIQDFVITAGTFQVEDGDFFGTGKTFDKGHGILLIDQQWKFDA
jgi:lipopolysaccharide transport system ATP-binding protein